MSKNTNLSFLTDYITADITNGRIGINNASPTVAFDVVGATKITGVLTLTSTISNGTYAYTLPSATGTLALTSALSGYLPLTGGTLTGALSGTSATFSSTLQTGGITGIAVAPFTNTLSSGSLDLAGGASLFGYANQAYFGNNIYYNSSFLYKATSSASLYYQDLYGNHLWLTAPSGTINTAVTLTERMRITSAGNVGIGTTSPLDTYAGRTVLTINNNGAYGAFLNFGYNGTLYGSIEQGTSELKIANYQNIPTIFYTNSAERMRITSGGAVLIGSSTQTYATKLEVVSAGDAISAKSDNGGAAIKCNPATTGSYSAYFVVGSTNAGFINHPTSSTTQYSVSPSDERLKYNIEKWDENVLDSFKSIKPKTYSHTADNDESIRYKGYIAQEMIDKFPEAYPIDNDGYYNYNPSAMVVYLTKAIQELSAEITILKNK